jgi:diguanylate cyclase (GGDEF)-like protein
LRNGSASATEDGDEFVLESGTAHIGFEVLPLKDAAGVHQGDLVVIRDITAQIEAEKALTRANEELRVRVADIESLHAELSEQAIRDPLTGLLNRRYLPEMLSSELGRAAREGYPVSFIMLDIDGFKRINDIHGHATGDLILRVLGSQLLSQIRAGDIACRYGGDEFLLVLTNTPLDAATRRAERWRTAFEESGEVFMGLDDGVSMSVGVATYPTHGESVEQVFAAADAAMYAAKAAGRNRVTISPA